MKNFAIGILFLLACAMPSFAFAGQDRIEVRASSHGYPSPGDGWDLLKIELLRPSDRNAYQNSVTEKLFVEVEEILKKRKIENSWQWVLVDAPSVLITMELNGKKFSLDSSIPYFGQKYYSSHPAATEENLMGKQAFDEVYAAIRRYVNTQILIQRE